MCSNSRDILNLTLSLSVALLTILIAWILTYAIITLRHLSHAVRRVLGLITEGEQIVATLKERVKEIGAILPVLVTGIEKLVTYLNEKRKTRDNVKSKSQNSK